MCGYDNFPLPVRILVFLSIRRHEYYACMSHLRSINYLADEPDLNSTQILPGIRVGLNDLVFNNGIR